MIVPTSDLFKLAYDKHAIGAYNINNLEQTLGLFKGCADAQSPFIIQLSKGARKYADKRMLEAIIRSASQMYPEALFAVHLDHGDGGNVQRVHRFRLFQLGDDRRESRPV